MRVILAAILMAWSGTSASACYSGLVVIPTADVVGRGEFCIELQYDGVVGPNSADTRVLNTQFGASPRLEVGLDLDLSENADSRVLANAKYLLHAGRTHAIGVGVCDVCRGTRACPYALVTHHSHPVRGHLGITRIDGSSHWFLGADHSVSDQLTLMADHTVGDENCSSVGLNYEMTGKFGIMVGVLLPNDGSEDTGFSMHLVFSDI